MTEREGAILQSRERITGNSETTDLTLWVQTDYYPRILPSSSRPYRHRR